MIVAKGSIGPVDPNLECHVPTAAEYTVLQMNDLFEAPAAGPNANSAIWCMVMPLTEPEDSGDVPCLLAAKMLSTRLPALAASSQDQISRPLTHASWNLKTRSYIKRAWCLGTSQRSGRAIRVERGIVGRCLQTGERRREAEAITPLKRPRALPIATGSSSGIGDDCK